MSKVLVTEDYLEDIADAIRGKLGVQTTYKPGQMAAAIGSIPTGITPTGTISITENGTVDVTQYATASVNVSGGGGGGATILSGTTEPTAAQGIDGDIYLQYFDLQDEFSALEYLAVASAGPYIDTGVKMNAINGFYVDFEYSSQPSGNYGIFGTNASGVEYCINYWNQVYVTVDNGPLGITPTTGRHTVEADLTGITIDGQAKTYTPSWTRQQNYNAFLFAFNSDGTPNKTANAKIYEVKLFNESSLVQHLIPAKRRSDNALGILDLVTGSFLGNAGTGSFVAGPELAYDKKPIESAYVKVSGAWQDLIGSDISDVWGVSA